MKTYTTLGDGIASLRLEDRPVPKPGPHDILVKMSAVALNYRDLLVVNGTGNWKPPAPRVPVSDGVGRIIESGKNVTRFRTGDRVAGIFLPKWLDGALTPEQYVDPLGGAAADGVMAEYCLFNEQAAVGIPEHLTDAEAAALPVAALTAWHAIRRRSRVQPGDKVLIQGTGGVSLFALQFTHALGGFPVVLSGSDEKLEKAKALGAAATINYKTHPAWEEQVLALTDGNGVDHIIEVVGGENLNRSLAAVKLSGTISFIGLIAGLSAPIHTYQFVQKNVTIHGIETGSREMFEEMNQFIGAQQLKPVVDRTFTFETFPQALRYIESGSHFGKVVVNI